MNLKDLKPASEFAKRYGCKTIVFGGPGTAKTPLAATAPRPVMLVTETGMLSVRHVTHLPCYLGDTAAKIDDFFKWVKESSETKNFDTICVDSVSHMAEVYLEKGFKANKHGQAAYGDMLDDMKKHLDMLNMLANKHAYLIAKEMRPEEKGRVKARPFFPGQALNAYVPHLFDGTWHTERVDIPGHGVQLAIRTKENFDVFARDRSGNLAELEFPNLTDIFNKFML